MNCLQNANFVHHVDAVFEMMFYNFYGAMISNRLSTRQSHFEDNPVECSGVPLLTADASVRLVGRRHVRYPHTLSDSHPSFAKPNHEIISLLHSHLVA